MANATARVAKASVRWSQAEFTKHSSATLAAATTFYTGAMLGLDTSGYVVKFDDAASLIFLGLVQGAQGDPTLPVGTAADGTIDLDIATPKRFELAISGVTVADIGKKVYASFDQTGVLTGGTVYGNLIGIVYDRVYAADKTTPVSGIALVEAAYGFAAGNKQYSASRTMAATGAQSLTKWDLNKTIFLPNTGAYALTLPAVAVTQAGDYLTFVKTHSAAQAVTLTGNAAENIDGGNTYAAIDALYDCATIVSTGTEWVIVSRDIA